MSRLKPGMHPLLNTTIINALYSKNIFSILNFIDAEIKQIVIITKLSYKDVVTIRKHIINKNSAVIHNGVDFYNQLTKNSAILQTGIKSLDLLLDGGLITGTVLELCGLPGSGKTQLCLTLLKNVVQVLNQNVFYIDTKRDFSGIKIKAMLDTRKMSEDKIANIMSKILVKQITTKFELIRCLYDIKDQLQNNFKLRLIIIDSLPPLFYQSTDYAENYGLMNCFINIMRLLANEYHIAFIVTNIVTTWYEGNFGSETVLTEKLGLGKYWLNVPNIRIMIKKKESINEYEFVILKSNKAPLGKTYDYT